MSQTQTRTVVSDHKTGTHLNMCGRLFAPARHKRPARITKNISHLAPGPTVQPELQRCSDLWAWNGGIHRTDESCIERVPYCRSVRVEGPSFIGIPATM